MTGQVPLVPGELRGFREFLLTDAGLLPVVHRSAGPWRDGRQTAVCSTGAEHPPPARDCACGFYGWYDPSGTTGAYGGAKAVIAASGRVVLGDRGFRAGQARVVAVALPPSTRWLPRSAARAREVLAAHYPSVQVYRSAREMVRDHPPEDVTALGVGPLDRSPQRCRRAAVALWALFVAAAYGVLLLPRDAVADVAQTWWPLVVLTVVGWQALVVALVVRSQPDDRGGPPTGAPPEP